MSTALLICTTLAVCVVLSVSALGKEHRSTSVKREDAPISRYGDLIGSGFGHIRLT